MKNKRIDKYWKFAKSMVRKETASIILVLAFLAAALSHIFVSPQLQQGSIHEGDIALKDVYAPYDFGYSWQVDEENTLKAKESALKKVPYALQRDLTFEEEEKSALERFLDVLEEEKERDAPVKEKISVLEKEGAGGKLSEKNLKFLLEYPDPAGLREKALTALENIFLTGYISSSSLNFLTEKGVSKVAVFNEETGVEIERLPKDLLTENRVQGMIKDHVAKHFKPARSATKQAACELISRHVSPNLVLDEKKTALKKEEAIRNVNPIYREWEVKKNELIIEKGKRVNALHIAQISQLKRVFQPGATPTFFLGVLLLFVLLGLVASVYASFNWKKDFLRETKSIAIVLLNMLFIIIVADCIMRAPLPSYFIPMASMGMMITLLIGFDIAFLSVILTSVLIAFLLVGGRVEMSVALIVGSTVGMCVVAGARRRTRILLAGLLAGAAKGLAIVCIGLINNMDLDFYVKDGLWSLASGLFSGFIVMGLLPVFENLFKVPTNISLLELTDLNHPLLKKLALEAPGTYHHSIMVGNLAEVACDSIGANSLLARVGAYYHDIGKIPKAEYFSENEMGAGSKHSKLAPSMSALIIAKHVKEGEEIARKHKLNNTIIDFINQHHGDSLIAYFYQKAIERSENGTVARGENFRYAGPKPQTKESAIILLADSVEASSRALDEPTPASIRHLVRKIINNKFIDGQLDECDLTLKDMHKIADSFVRVLMGVFHTRLNYPEEKREPSNRMLPNVSKNKQRKPKQKKKD